MRKFPHVSLCLVIVTVVSLGLYAAEDTHVQRTSEQISKLIQQLDADAFNERLAARNDLQAIGPAALPALAEAAKTSASAEVRDQALRLSRIIRASVYADLVRYIKASDWQSAKPLIEKHRGPDLAVVLGDMLANFDLSEAAHAAYAMRLMGADCKAALPQMMKALSSQDGGLFCDIAATLGDIGADAQPAVPELWKYFAREVPNKDWVAMVALNRIVGPAIIPEYLKKLDDADARMREAALRGLAWFGSDSISALAQVIPALADPAPNVRQAACIALDSIITADGALPADAIPKIIDNLGDADPGVQTAAIKLVKRAGHAAADACPLLEKLLQNKDRDRREEVARALVAVKAKLTPVIEQALVEEAAHGEYGDGDWAAGALAEFGAGAIPALLKILKTGPTPFSRWRPAYYLRKIDPLPKALIPDLITALSDNNWAVGRDCAFLLGRFGKDASAAVPALEKLLAPEVYLKDWYGELTVAAARAIWRITGESGRAVPTLLDIAKLYREAPNWLLVREQACEALAEAGKGRDDVLPFLEKALQDVQLRTAVARALGAMGAAAKPAAADLKQVLMELAKAAKLDDTDPLRFEATRALWQITADSEEVVPELLKSVDPATGDIYRHESAKLLAITGRGRPDVLRVFIGLLSDPDDALKEIAANGLGEWGALAKEALPALQRMMRAEYAGTRRAAIRAMRSIDPDKK